MSKRPPYWSALAQSVKRRDGFRCTRCGSTRNLEAHHRKPISEGGTDTYRNLTTLCSRCHLREHSTPGRSGWIDLIQEVTPA